MKLFNYLRRWQSTTLVLLIALAIPCLCVQAQNCASTGDYFFETYPWLKGYVDQDKCIGIRIDERVGPEGSNILSISSAEKEAIMIFRADGSFVCFDAGNGTNCQDQNHINPPINSFCCGEAVYNIYTCPGEPVNLYPVKGINEKIGSEPLPDNAPWCDNVVLLALVFNDTTSYDYDATGRFFTVNPTESTSYRASCVTGPPENTFEAFCLNASFGVTYNVIVEEELCNIPCNVAGGNISTNDPTEIYTLDGIDDIVDVNLTGNLGSNSLWVITDANFEILDLASSPPFNFEGSDPGFIYIWHLSFESEGLTGAFVGNNATLLDGCFELSNPLGIQKTADPIELLARYEWLGEVLEDACNATVTSYDLGSYEFVYVLDSNGGTLYFEDGTLYCTDGAAYNCLDIYNLSQADQTLNNAGDCGEAGEEGEGEGESNSEIFNTYPWLSSSINLNNCSAGDMVEVYDLGAYSFVFVTSNSQTLMYYQDGTFYCSNTLSYDCANAYGLGSPTDTWICGEDGEPVTPPEEGGPFENFSWLENLIDFSDCAGGDAVTEYVSGPYSYILVSTAGSASLYFQDGTLYCTNSANYDCVAAYGFTQIGEQWSCSGKKSVYERQEIPQVSDWSIYPNPSDGPVNLDFSPSSLMPQTMAIFDMQGKLVLQRDGNDLSPQNRFDLSNLNNGNYIVFLQFEDFNESKKLILLR